MIECNLLHVSEKPDNARRIIHSNSVTWNIKNVYTWDYDGPAVRITKFHDLQGMRYLKTGLTLLAVIAIPTYRIWPRFLQVSSVVDLYRRILSSTQQ